jgi:hypothetical protein
MESSALFATLGVKFHSRQLAARGARNHTEGTFAPDIRNREQGGSQNGDLIMTYRVYSGPRGSEAISPLEKDRYLYKEFSMLDEALGWARHLNAGGRVALLIEGDDGTRLNKQQIAATLTHPEAGKTAEHGRGHAA